MSQQWLQLNPGLKCSKWVSARVSEADYTAAKVLATKRRTGLSSMIRRLLESELDKEGLR